MYLRVFSGQIQPGQHAAFLAAVEAAVDYQQQRGIRIRTTVWNALTGDPNRVTIDGEFQSLQDLETFEELVAQDQQFAELRAAVRRAMVFETSTITLYRKML